MKRELYTLFKDIEFIAANAAVKIMKLREITSGFIKQENKNVVGPVRSICSIKGIRVIFDNHLLGHTIKFNMCECTSIIC